MAAATDLALALAEAEAARARLIETIASLDAATLARSRPGGWTLGRVLQHLAEAEAIYVRLLAHMRGAEAPGIDTAPIVDGASAVAALRATRARVVRAVAGIADDSLYRLVRFGHEEYSALSILENIAHHDDEHREQIEQILYAPGRLEAGRTERRPDALRPARAEDLPRLVEIYNHYVRTTAITFDLEPWTVGQRRPWLEQFRETGPHRLLVAERDGLVVGYAGSHRFRDKAAYDTTVETTIYCAPGATGGGIGKALYDALFAALTGEDVHLAVAGITLPNPASVALHERFGFVRSGIMHAVGRKFGRYWDVAWYEKRL
jgi:phosphinothricin acetyltransferase